MALANPHSARAFVIVNCFHALRRGSKTSSLWNLIKISVANRFYFAVPAFMILRYGDVGFWEGLFTRLTRFCRGGASLFLSGHKGKGKKKGWADSLSDVMSDFDSTRKDGQVTSKISFVCDLCGFTYHSNSFQRIFMNFCLG